MYNGTLTIAGETSPGRPFSMKKDPRFLAIIKVLQDADTTFAHEEGVIHNWEGYNIRPWELFMNPFGPPVMAKEFKWAGIDMMSTASNHCYEWGEEGVRANNMYLRKASIAPAGTGQDLTEAAAPAYYESSAGRVALISMSSGHHPYDSAGLANPPCRGRPGLNPLRIFMKYTMDPETANMLKEVWTKLDLWKAMRGHQIRRYVPMNEEEGDFYLDFEHVYESYIEQFYFGVGDECKIEGIPIKWDVERNLKMIKEAKTQADLVLVAHHTQCAEGLRDWVKPSSYIPPFAKACIDAGADAYIGHGWHRELGIEIYKGKPLFYSCGNFIGGNTKTGLPSDTYEGVGLDLNLLTSYTPMDARRAAGRETYVSFFDDPKAKKLTPTQIGGIVNLLTWDNGKLSELKLYPYEYGRVDAQRAGSIWDGTVKLAKSENTEILLDYKKELSAQYGTSINIEGEVGYVKI